MAASKRTRYACACWQIGDIQSLRPMWSDQRCADFLRSNSRHIEDAMVQAGWEAIEELLPSKTAEEMAYEEEDDDEATA